MTISRSDRNSHSPMSLKTSALAGFCIDKRCIGRMYSFDSVSLYLPFISFFVMIIHPKLRALLSSSTEHYLRNTPYTPWGACLPQLWQGASAFQLDPIFQSGRHSTINTAQQRAATSLSAQVWLAEWHHAMGIPAISNLSWTLKIDAPALSF